MNDIEELIKSHKRLIESEASKYSRFLPITFVTIEAYKLARTAAEKYDPKTGHKFSTYLTNALQKLSRLSTQYGNVVRIPENKQFKINRVNQIETGLTEELGRPPSMAELSDATGMGLSALNGLIGTRKKEVNMSNLAFSPVFFEGGEDEWIHFVYHDLSEKDKLIFEHRTGFGNKPILDNNAIAKKLGISPSTVSQRVKMITDKIAQGMNS